MIESYKEAKNITKLILEANHTTTDPVRTQNPEANVLLREISSTTFKFISKSIRNMQRNGKKYGTHRMQREFAILFSNQFTSIS